VAAFWQIGGQNRKYNPGLLKNRGFWNVFAPYSTGKNEGASEKLEFLKPPIL
jgi:hypothetical protein